MGDEVLMRVYLDHGATTSVRPEVAQIVLEHMTRKYGNPSSMHYLGREAKEALEDAREQVSGVINSLPEEIIFTSGGTEADNLAIAGVARYYADKGKHLITSAVEHHAVLDACINLEQAGYEITILPVDEYGAIDIDDLRKAIRKDTTLISIMHANNEVGTLQPLQDIGKLAQEHEIIFHVDAVQSLGKIPIDVQKMNIDLLSGSGHKIYGPKGSGFLFLRRGVGITSLTYGGEQEKRFRPGTENVPGIVGLAQALVLSSKEMEHEMDRISKLQKQLIQGVMERIPDVKLNGHPVKRVPINVNLSFKDIEAESLLMALDLEGIAASAGSACSSGIMGPSHVIKALGVQPEFAPGTIRMTLGRENTDKDIGYVLEKLPPIVERLRKKSSSQERKIGACNCSKG